MCAYVSSKSRSNLPGNNLTSTAEHKVIENVEDNLSLDSLISELEKSEYSQPNSAPMSTPKPTSQKESVFVRLANRIKVRGRRLLLCIRWFYF